MAVAAKATTRPVMTRAWGTGSLSAPEPRRRQGPAAALGYDPEEQEDTAAEEVEGEDLAQGPGVADEAIEAKPHQGGAAQTVEGGGGHVPGPRSATGGPSKSSPRMTASDGVRRISMARIRGLARPSG